MFSRTEGHGSARLRRHTRVVFKKITPLPKQVPFRVTSLPGDIRVRDGRGLGISPIALRILDLESTPAP